MDRPSVVEFNELNGYVRHQTGVYFTWLNFFLTIVLAAMSWGSRLQLTLREIPVSPTVFVVLLIFFMIQIALGIGATNSVSADLTRSETRARSLMAGFDRAVPEPGYVPPVPLPVADRRSVELARRALIANLIFWPIAAPCTPGRRRRPAPSI